jgi:ribosomal protein S18 acetylase RimI-like enzyme
VTRRTPTADDLAEIRALGALCNRTDGLNLKLNWDLMRARSPEVVSDFCAYAGDELIGYVALDGDDEELELTGMVHPAHRRQGIARALVTTAREECQRRGTERLLLVCERPSASGRAFVAAIGAHFSFAEYHMEADATSGQVVPKSKLLLCRAEHGDIPLVAEMQARCWGNSGPVPEAQVQQMARRFDEPGSRYYRAFVQGEAVGQIGVLFEENQIYIRGVGILPEQRRRGYGRQMLAATVATLIAEGQTHFSLDVATENDRALELYRSCGFAETNVYEYHALPLD